MIRQNALALWAKPKTITLLALGALGLWLGFPNDLISLPILVLFWPLALFLLGTSATSLRSAYLLGFASNALGMSLVLYWLYFPIHDVGGLPGFGAAFCALCVALAYAAIMAIFPASLYLVKKLSQFKLAFFAATIWAGLEIFLDQIAGFPWLTLAGALVVWPSLVQTAALCSQFGTSFLWLLALSFLLTPLRPIFEQSLLPSKTKLLHLGLGALLVGALACFGIFQLANYPFNHPPAHAQSLDVLFVEGNFDQSLKWRPSLQRQTLESYLSLTTKALAKSSKKPLVIWPETALPFFFERSPLLAGFVRDLAKQKQIPLLFGTPGTTFLPPRDGSPSPVYNRAILLGPDGSTLGQYDKEHLVPFGEYLPHFFHFSFLEPLLQEIGGYTEGQKSGTLDYAGMKAGLLICYEGIFPELAYARVASGANILIDLSNDAWFAKTPAQRQHLYLTCVRAIEQKRYILRGTNSGISAVIDFCGRITQRGPLFQQGTLTACAYLIHEHSPLFLSWTKLCYLFLIFLGLALLILGTSLRQEKLKALNA
ncbi:MAG: apolipoprotein N-acyltransferase [Desulfovibrio sp.]|nr:apolipoprotein N-acyltransferase [Desulfovibrio sp.]